jgi:hypothetical protein
MNNYIHAHTENFSEQFEIGKLSKDIGNKLLVQIDDKTLIINTACLWPTPKNFQMVENKINEINPNKIFLLADIDWDRHDQNDPLIDMLETKYNAEWIGNFPGKYYFSFWLEFIRTYSLEYDMGNYDPIINESKLYMTLNRKPHYHRVVFVERLYKHQLEDFGFITLGTTNPEDPPNTALPVPLILPKESLFISDEKVKRGNRQVINDVGLPNDILSLGTEYYWRRHFINVTVETTDWSNGFLSEKTFKPILGLRPFVILGDYNLYDILHEFNIDTFDDIFGTWYRDKDYYKRINNVIDILNKFSQIPNNELADILYFDIKDRLENNRIKLFEAATKNHNKLHTLFSNNK